MKPRIIRTRFRPLVTVVALVGWSFAPLVGADDLQAPDRTAVIVELFTSQGCSSCPAADLLLGELQRSQPIEGATIIPLSQHVDYWNYLGWDDPYSSESFTRRQRAYARRFRNNAPYTPQMVVDGTAELVGSDRRAALDAIEAAARTPKATVRVRVVTDSSAHLRLHARIGDLPPLTDKRAKVMLALTESNLAVSVKAGENSGRQLSHQGVVRELRPLDSVNPRSPRTIEVETTVRVLPDWKPEDLLAVIFVQEPSTGRVLGAGTAPLYRVATPRDATASR